MPVGKVYLSPIVDCFDGLLVMWHIDTSPDSNLVNTMLDHVIQQLQSTENQSCIQTEEYIIVGQDG